MSVLKYLKILKKNKIAYVALTRRCNCRCPSCEIWESNDSIDTNKFSEYGFERLASSDFGIIEFTGGEPLLLYNTPSLIAQAKEYGFLVQLMTNGTISSDKKIGEVAKSGVDIVSVSVDCWDDKRASEHRRFKNINEKIKETVKKMKENGILVSSSTLITRKNYNDIEKTVEFVNNNLGIYFSFCLPEFSENYKVGEKKSSIAVSDSEMISVLQKILELKKNGHKILNTNAYIRDAIRWFSGKMPRYSCMAGKTMIYVDWNMRVHPCFIRESICTLDELEKKKLEKQDCNLCCFQCFREPSVFYYKRGKIAFLRDIGTLLSTVNRSGF